MNTSYTADEVYDKTNQCPWTPGGQQTIFYSLNMVTQATTIIATPERLWPRYAKWLTDWVRLLCVDCMCSSPIPAASCFTTLCTLSTPSGALISLSGCPTSALLHTRS